MKNLHVTYMRESYIFAEFSKIGNSQVYHFANNSLMALMEPIKV